MTATIEPRHGNIGSMDIRQDQRTATVDVSRHQDHGGLSVTVGVFYPAWRHCVVNMDCGQARQLAALLLEAAA